MSELTIDVEARQETGKNSNRRARSRGLIPAVVYGAGRDTLPIQVARKTMLEMMKAAGSEHPIFLLKLAGSGKERHAMIREVQIDPISRQVLHIDFQRVLMTEKIRVQVAIELTGTAVGVKTEGGLLDFVNREVTVECLPGDIPRQIELDVAPLHIGQHVEAGQLELPKGVVLADEPTRLIVSVTHAKLEPTVEAEVVATPATSEPEVIKRGKVDEA